MLEHTSLVEIHGRLCCVCGASVVVLCIVEQWHRKFVEGCTSIDDATRSGRLNEAVDDIVHWAHALLEEEHCYTITSLQVQIAAWYAHNTSHTTIHTALHEHVRMLKVSARWVLR